MDIGLPEIGGLAGLIAAAFVGISKLAAAIKPAQSVKQTVTTGDTTAGARDDLRGLDGENTPEKVTKQECDRRHDEVAASLRSLGTKVDDMNTNLGKEMRQMAKAIGKLEGKIEGSS